MGIDTETGELLWNQVQDNTPIDKREPGNGDTHSNTVLFEDSNQLINHLKDSKLIILEGADHNYTNPNDKEKVIKETVNFIQEVLL